VSTAIREFVLHQPLFCSHNHHESFDTFVADSPDYDFRSLLSYANADLVTAAGARPSDEREEAARFADLWLKVRATGHGQATLLTCRELFDLKFAPENLDRITEELQSLIHSRPVGELYDHLLRERANTSWVVNDGFTHSDHPAARLGEQYPSYYFFTWRMDALFSMVDSGPVAALERTTGLSIHTLDDLVEAANESITRFKAAVRLGAFKVKMGYERDLSVGHPTRHEAEAAFNAIRYRKAFYDGIQQESGAVSAREGRPLGDYLFHCLMQRAHDEDIPVQVHSGCPGINWGAINGANASLLLPIFEKYRRVRFCILHASWPWTSELGAIAKNYPNVYPDMSWAWNLNPAGSERALSEWLDGVPFNKIFAYGADTGWPWCDVGNAMQARIGVARVLEQKIESGYFSATTAEEVATAIMHRNGEELLGLS
jgi:predicted TIM-barrel fold metal-dependent hydrolase